MTNALYAMICVIAALFGFGLAWSIQQRRHDNQKITLRLKMLKMLRRKGEIRNDRSLGMYSLGYSAALKEIREWIREEIPD